MTSTGLGETNSTLGGHKQNLACTKTQRKEAETPQETEPDLLLVLEGLMWRHWSAVAHCRDRGTGSNTPERGRLVQVLLEFSTNPTIETTDPRAGSPQAKKLTGKEHNPTHQQIIGLKH